jgi:hypothetical protein
MNENEQSTETVAAAAPRNSGNDLLVTKRDIAAKWSIDEAQVTAAIKALGLNKQGKGLKPKQGAAPDLYDADEFDVGYQLLVAYSKKVKPAWVPPPKEEKAAAATDG